MNYIRCFTTLLYETQDQKTIWVWYEASKTPQAKVIIETKVFIHSSFAKSPFSTVTYIGKSLIRVTSDITKKIHTKTENQTVAAKTRCCSLFENFLINDSF